ncbi:restriction endonuclease subunit S [Phascolarctobacterium sp.]|uniref:restriction endonuclease subunit S n=1 Tax=Phascolarctobacterium sp. TaxID=2049039 RepID=UPI00302F7497
MKERRLEPKRRFKEFKNTSAWELHKLGDITTEMVAGGDIDKDLILDEGRYPVIANALTNDGIVGYYNTDYRIEAPAVTVTGRGDVGHAKARIADFTPVVRLLSIKSYHDVFFLENAINTLKIVIESTGVPQLTVPQLARYELSFPKSLDEEEKIGSYFRNLDRLIALHQRKCDKLANVKKALLEKMFPKKEKNIPEMRFKGFTDAWERRKLGEIATFINGRAYAQDELLDEGKYKVLRVGNFYTNDSWYYSNMELGEKYYANTDDLLYTWSASFGPHIWLGDKVIYHYHIWKVELSENFVKQFAVQILDYDKSKIMSDHNGSTMIHITKSGMENKIILLPSVEEQKKIGVLINSLDRLITLHQRKLKKLQNIKKAYLNEMFI